MSPTHTSKRIKRMKLPVLHLSTLDYDTKSAWTVPTTCSHIEEKAFHICYNVGKIYWTDLFILCFGLDMVFLMREVNYTLISGNFDLPEACNISVKASQLSLPETSNYLDCMILAAISKSSTCSHSNNQQLFILMSK